tara:strand:+ start:347 stop:577 length:231 start_codon:yes stop_codon:yes gene_type:complete
VIITSQFYLPNDRLLDAGDHFEPTVDHTETHPDVIDEGSTPLPVFLLDQIACPDDRLLEADDHQDNCQGPLNQHRL